MFAASQSRTENAADCFATTSWLREGGLVTVEIGSECDCVRRLLLPDESVPDDGGEIVVLWLPSERRAGAFGK
jgi:hypothetical protein